MNNDVLLEQIAHHYGLDHQLNKCVEEMAELAIEISKYNNTDEKEKHTALFSCIVEEIADVAILIRQLQLLCGEERVKGEIDRKIKRQIKRIEAENK